MLHCHGISCQGSLPSAMLVVGKTRNWKFWDHTTTYKKVVCVSRDGSVAKFWFSTCAESYAVSSWKTISVAISGCSFRAVILFMFHSFTFVPNLANFTCSTLNLFAEWIVHDVCTSSRKAGGVSRRISNLSEKAEKEKIGQGVNFLQNKAQELQGRKRQ